MLSPRGNGGLIRVSSSSSSSSSSQSLSPFSSSSLQQNPRSKTMEEVWKDINLASLHDHPSREDSHMILQDFLAQPFTKDHPANVPAGYPSPTPPPATVLNLNSTPEFHFVGNSDSIQGNLILQTRPVSYSGSLGVPFDALVGSANLPELGKKRFPESENCSGDRRHKRMIKNRESAARSRARKQEYAYTNELELEVAHLVEENARLKRQQQELCLDAAAQLPKKHSLYRTSTAPF